MSPRRRAAGMIASGLLVSLSFPSWLTPELTPWTGWLAWAALVPALRALDGAAPRTALWLGFVGGFTRWASTIYWVAAIREFEIFRIPTWLIFSAVLACFCAGWAWLVARGTAKRMIWVAPAAWIVMEWTQGRIFSGFPWTPLGASQWAWSPLFFWSSVVGVLGLGALVVMVNVQLARGRSVRVAAWVALAVSMALLVVGGGLTIGHGTLRPPGRELVVALLQGGFTETEKWTLPPEDQLARYEGLAGDAGGGARKPDVMIWPETATVALIETRGLVPRLSALAKRTGAAQVVGALSQDVEFRVFNGAFVIAPSGVTGRYHKNRLVPFGEFIPGWFRMLVPIARKLTAGLVDMTPGTEAVPVTLPGDAKAGIMVCYESVYPDLARRQVAAGAQVLINVTNDAWYGRTAATFQHALGPISRAVETGRTVLRCANTGLTLVANSDGTVRRTLPIFSQGVQVEPVRLESGRTVYSRYGDWPALLVGIAMLALAFGIRRA